MLVEWLLRILKKICERQYLSPIKGKYLIIYLFIYFYLNFLFLGIDGGPWPMLVPLPSSLVTTIARLSLGESQQGLSKVPTMVRSSPSEVSDEATHFPNALN